MKRLILMVAGLVVGGLMVQPGAALAQEDPEVEVSEEAAEIIQFLEWECDEFEYEDQCLFQMRSSIENAEELSESDQEQIYSKVRSYKEEHAFLAGRIDGVLEEFSLPLTDPEE